MACGCKDIENDNKIIDYYNNKKTLEMGPKKQYTNMMVEWEGLLSEWSIYIHDETDILTIEKTETGWKATTKQFVSGV